MSFAAPLQNRFVLILGALAAGALVAVMVMRMTVLKVDDSTTATPPVTHQTAVTPATPTAPAKPKHVKPVIHLNAGLPVPLAKALRRRPVVVAVLWAPQTGDQSAITEARAGAKATHAGFVALNVFDERQAKALATLVGPASDPTVLVVKRPGTIAMRVDGFADRTIVAQAAHDSGAR